MGMEKILTIFKYLLSYLSPIGGDMGTQLKAKVIWRNPRAYALEWFEEDFGFSVDYSVNRKRFTACFDAEGDWLNYKSGHQLKGSC